MMSHIIPLCSLKLSNTDSAVPHIPAADNTPHRDARRSLFNSLNSTGKKIAGNMANISQRTGLHLLLLRIMDVITAAQPDAVDLQSFSTAQRSTYSAETRKSAARFNLKPEPLRRRYITMQPAVNSNIPLHLPGFPASAGIFHPTVCAPVITPRTSRYPIAA